MTHGEPPTVARWAGVLAVVFYVIHAVVLAQRGEPEHALWVCHVASLVVGVGVVARAPLVNAVGMLWLAVGVPIWLIGLVGGHELLLTSPLTHLGGFAVGLYGAWRLGIPKPAWLVALLGAMALHGICRWLTPPAANVNFSFQVWPGWESVYPSHLAFVLVVFGASAVSFLGVQFALRRAGWRTKGRSP